MAAKAKGHKEHKTGGISDHREAIDRLDAQLVKLLYFVGLTQEQAAEELEVSLATVERDWAFARAWLKREIQRSQKAPN